MLWNFIIYPIRPYFRSSYCCDDRHILGSVRRHPSIPLSCHGGPATRSHGSGRLLYTPKTGTVRSDRMSQREIPADELRHLVGSANNKIFYLGYNLYCQDSRTVFVCSTCFPSGYSIVNGIVTRFSHFLIIYQDLRHYGYHWWSYFQAYFSNWWQRNLLWNCPQGIVAGPNWW